MSNKRVGRRERQKKRGGTHKWSTHSLQKIIFGDFIFLKRHVNMHTQTNTKHDLLSY
jgi:hypothetical protein